MVGSADESPWAAVIARALAYHAMHLAGIENESILKRAQFLMSLGIPRADAAEMLGSNDESVRVGLSKAKKREAGNG